MSYVLDALRKAEKDRRNQTDVGLDNMNQEDWNRPPDIERGSSSKIWIFGALSVLICIAMVIFQYGPASSVEVEATAARPAEPQPMMIEEDPQRNRPTLVEADAPESEPQIPEQDLAARITAFQFEGNLYIESNRAASRVFINGGAYKIGDALQGEIYLVDIAANTVTLSDGYDQVIQRLR